MSFLEMTLESSIESFLSWVAAHDFTAECVLFLMRVRNFRRNWQAKSLRGALSNADLRELYQEAAEIFFELVEPETAEIPVNLSGRIVTELREQFRSLEFRGSKSESANGSLYGVLSFDDLKPPSRASNYTTKEPAVILSKSTTESDTIALTSKEKSTSIRVPYTFSVKIFDKAYEMVKDDVYRGPWPLYQDKFGRINLTAW